MSNNKMKGLLKGLRYISQIFDNEKEPEMQIGYPTDVKHVAHIGWDGPSVNSPSWMNEFKSPEGFSSAPLNLNEDMKEDSSIKWVSEDSSRRGSRASNSPALAPSSPTRPQDSPARDLPEVPKSSRRHSSTSTATESPTREKSDKSKQSRRSSRNATKESTRQGSESPSNLPDVPKKSRRKKSKEASVGGSTSRSSRSKAQASDVDGGSESGSVSKVNNEEHCRNSDLSTLEEGEENEFTRIS